MPPVETWNPVLGRSDGWIFSSFAVVDQIQLVRPNRSSDNDISYEVQPPSDDPVKNRATFPMHVVGI